MQFLAASGLQPGMVIAQDVLTGDGRVLIRSGVRLTEPHIRKLQAQGIEGAYIAPPADTSGPAGPIELSENQQQRIEADLDERFSLVDHEHPLIQELMRMYRSRAARALVEGSAHGG